MLHVHLICSRADVRDRRHDRRAVDRLAEAARGVEAALRRGGGGYGAPLLRRLLLLLRPLLLPLLVQGGVVPM